MVKVDPEVFEAGAEGIVFGCGIEVNYAADETFGGIGEVELERGSHIALKFEESAVHLVFRADDQRVFDGGCFYFVLIDLVEGEVDVIR